MSAADKVNELFWLNYAREIKNKTGANFSKDGSAVFFLATDAQKGPPAGKFVPSEYTNTGLYHLANNLLATDQLFYAPSGLHGYAQTLNTYLNFVDLQRGASTELGTALYSALQHLQAAEAVEAEQEDAAYAKYEKERGRGMVENDMTFNQWVAIGHGSAYRVARENHKAKAAVVATIQSQINGGLAAELDAARAAVNAGLNSETALDGFNMRGAIGNFLTAEEIMLKQQLKQQIPQPKTQLLPLYEAPLYQDFVKGGETKIGTKYTPTDSIEFHIQTSEKTDNFDFGQTKVDGSAEFSFGPWFGFGAGGGHSTETTTVNTGSESESVKIKITFDKIQNIPIDMGKWNVDLSKYKLRDDAPPQAKTLARVSSLVVASALGYEITVGANTAREIDTKLKETTQGGGSLNIFGIPIRLGGSASREKVSNSHTATFNEATNTLKIAPRFETGYATVIGIVGEKFNAKHAE